MPILSVRLTDEQSTKLDKLLKRTLGNQTSNETMSVNFRRFIEKLYDTMLSKTSDIRRCPVKNSTVSISSVCSKCRDRTPTHWENCQARTEESGDA